MVHTAFYRGLERAQRSLHAGGPPAARAASAHRLLDDLVAATKATWACRAGCAHCCRHPVGVTFDEALALCSAIRALPAATAVRVAADVTAAAQAVRGESWRALAGVPCPLLDGDRCAVYAARPLGCRAWGSTDAQACARNAAGEAVAIPFDAQAFGLGLGIGRALAGEPGHRELRAAVAAVLTAADDDAARTAFATLPAAGADTAAGSG